MPGAHVPGALRPSAEENLGLGIVKCGSGLRFNGNQLVRYSIHTKSSAFDLKLGCCYGDSFNSL